MSADTSPAAMPGEEDVARLVADVMSRDNHALALHTARKIKALFAPILAEKERLAEALHYANGVAELAMKHRDAAEAALAAERERAAQIGYRVCAETRHVTLGDKVAAAIRAQGE